MRPLKLYSSKAWLGPGREGAHVTALAPFWGRPTVSTAGWPHYADTLIARAHEFLELTELADADVAVFPLIGRLLLRDPGGVERVRDFAGAARAAGKPTAVFFDHADTHGHIHAPFPVRDALLFRGSLFRNSRRKVEFALPGFHDDLLSTTGGTLPIRPKSEPVISFCGSVISEHAPPKGAREHARKVLGDTRRFMWRMQGRHEEDLFVRARAVRALLAQKDVRTSILVRESGGGGTWTSFDQERWNIARREFVDNLIDSDYVLCARGDGNWSIRFYEAMCLGRIPIVVDTDLVMPYDFVVPWREYGVWVERSEVAELSDKVAAFHERLSDGEYRDLQRECRRVWEQYLSPLGFFRNLHRHFER